MEQRQVKMPKKIIPTKVPMREQPASERIHNYQEVPYGYTPEQAIEEAIRCLQCAKPKCIEGCPVGVQIPQFINALREGDFVGAVEAMNAALKLTPNSRSCWDWIVKPSAAA